MNRLTKPPTGHGLATQRSRRNPNGTPVGGGNRRRREGAGRGSMATPTVRRRATQRRAGPGSRKDNRATAGRYGDRGETRKRRRGSNPSVRRTRRRRLTRPARSAGSEIRGGRCPTRRVRTRAGSRNPNGAVTGHVATNGAQAGLTIPLAGPNPPVGSTAPPFPVAVKAEPVAAKTRR